MVTHFLPWTRAVRRAWVEVGNGSPGSHAVTWQPAGINRWNIIVVTGYPAAVLKDLATGVVVLATAAFVLYRALAPFRRIWGGDASATIGLPSRQSRVKARNYLAYLLWVVPGASGALILGVLMVWATVSHWQEKGGLPLFIAGVGVFLFVGAWPLALVHVFVNATNRPRFLVPPPYRSQPGEVAAWGLRRARKRAGQPPTDHRVEILEIPDDDDGQPWLTAQCSDVECDWSANVDPSLGTPMQRTSCA